LLIRKGGDFIYLGDIFSFIDEHALSYATMIIRFLLPLLAVIVVARCVKSLFNEKSEAENWGYLSLPNGARIYLNHWENIIGRANTSDVYMEYPSISRNHAAVIRDDKGNWRAYDVESKAGVMVNGVQIESRDGVPIESGDIIELGGVQLVFFPIDKASEYKQAAERTRPGIIFKPRTTLIFLTEFQLLLGLQLCISKGKNLTLELPLSFAVLIASMWLLYFVTRAMRRTAFEIETLAFFLCTIGLAVTASSEVSDVTRQIAFLLAGIVLFIITGLLLRDLNLAKKMRMPIAVGGLGLLAANLLFGVTIHGARRWIEIGGFSFQPSEFVKIAFVFVGAATMERMFARRNLLTFVAFSGVCVMVMALIVDFGSAMVFFTAYLIIAFLRSGDFATIFLSIGGAVSAGFMALRLWSHIAARFATWGRAWEFASGAGYQQTNAMGAVASGGLFGVGAGNGWFSSVFAADSDLVFAMVSEEMGFILALTAVAALLIFAVFSARSAGTARSSFYVIGACAASSIFVFQMLLNVLGSLDILPFTGITFPFVSRGGTSLIASWGLLAFIKAADTRQNASFVVKTPKKPTDDMQSFYEFPNEGSVTEYEKS